MNKPASFTRDNKRDSLNIFLCGQDVSLRERIATEWHKTHCNYSKLSQVQFKPFIAELECIRKSTPFVSVSGLDFLFQADHASLSVNDTKLCLQKCLTVVLSPQGDEQGKFLKQLHMYHMPYMISTTTDVDVAHLIELLNGTLEGKFPANLIGDFPLSLPFPHPSPRTNCIVLRSLCVSDDQIKLSHEALTEGKSNRMIDRYKASNFLIVNFNFKMQPKNIISILSKGIWISGEEHHFIGCSSSGLKKRSCYMMKGKPGDVTRIRDKECGKFPLIQSIPKKLKGVGLLFSNACPVAHEIRDDKVIIEDDIMTKDGRYNFTDGCGAIGTELHAKIIEGARLHTRLPEGYRPSVLQIRYQGFKGVVALDPIVDKDKIVLRKSMRKFESGTRPFFKVWLCNYSKPYSVGYLNKQYIMLLSGLGVPNEVFLKKQEEYYHQMRTLKQDSKFSFEQLCINGRPELAARIAAGGLSDKVVQDELSRIQVKFNEKLTKLRIQVRDSRNVFGVCDTSGVLECGQCFFRPSINDQPHTIKGQVIVAKNPCYFLGDMRVLTAVDGAQVRHLNHLIDCIVFPTRGPRPHPDEISGSDLDGDEYMVCWDSELSIPAQRTPANYSALASAAAAAAPKQCWQTCIEYMANQVNMMGLLDSYFLYWAETKGVQSSECQELGQLFSRSVDASKTGDKFRVPAHLVPPKEKKAVAEHDMPVWKKMEKIAQETQQQYLNSLTISSEDSNLSVFSESLIRAMLLKGNREMSDFQFLSVLKKWCYSQNYTDMEVMEKLAQFSLHINFGSFTLKEKLDSIDLGIPAKTVTNALNSSQLLTEEMMREFSLQDPHSRWCFFFRSTAAEFVWEELTDTLATYPESLLVFRLENGVIIALHFLTKMNPAENKITAGSIIAYFFSPSFKLMCRHILGSSYWIELNSEHLQLYRNGRKENTFIWLKGIALSKNDLTESSFDRISVDLTTFQKDIYRTYNHTKVNKQQFQMLEVYVKSGTEEPTYYDRLLSDFACALPNEEEEEEKVEVISRDMMEDKDADSVPSSDLSPIKLLEFHARHGRVSEFSKSLVSIEDKGTKELFINALQMLLTTVVNKWTHLSNLPADSSELIAIITSLEFAISSPQLCLSILHKVSLLRSVELTKQVSSIILSCIKLGSILDYVETLVHWEWWCFLPPELAYHLLDTLYSMSKSLVSSRDTSLPNISLQETCKEVQSFKMESDIVLRECYVCFYSYIFHSSFLSEMNSEGKSASSTGSTVDMLKVCDAKFSTECPDSDDPSKPRSLRKIEFYRSKGISFKYEGHAIISFMTTTELQAVPVACGNIVEVSVQPTNILVEIAEPIPVCLEESIKSGRGHWQLHSVGNVTSFERGMRAIQSLCAGTSTILIPALVHPEGSIYTDQFKDLLGFTCAEMTPHCVKPSLEPSVLLSDKSTSLNTKQKEAVMLALNQSLTLVHGPPGTGKTRVAYEIICQYCHQKLIEQDKQAKVLVTAETNMAVDNLTRRLIQQGIKVVRVGSKEAMSSDIFCQTSLEIMVARRSSKSRHAYIDRRVATEVLREADVVAATCVGAGDSILNSFTFPLVIVDEATQVKEPISLIALTKACKQLVLIGDPEQLAPYHRQSQRSTIDDNIAITLFHRLQKAVPSVFLEEQHRMNSQLVKFPSEHFYGGKLRCSSGMDSRLVHFKLNQQKPIDFIDVTASKEKHIGTSFKNEKEADIVVNVVDHLISCNVSPLEIAVLTPYRQQLVCIVEKLSGRISNVNVSTIDNFQGRENDVIVFSTVRSVHGDLAFIANPTRVNVLLTRAKHCIIGVGSRAVLEKTDLWRGWLAQANCITSDDLGHLCVSKEVDSNKTNFRSGQHHRGQQQLHCGQASGQSRGKGHHHSQHSSDQAHHGRYSHGHHSDRTTNGDSQQASRSHSHHPQRGRSRGNRYRQHDNSHT